MTGILLRKDLKINFDSKLPQLGEIVFAQDTNEIGMLVDGELYWRSWIDTLSSINYLYTGENIPDASLGEDGDKYIQTKDNGGNIEIIEFVQESGVWRELQRGETDIGWVDENLETNYHTLDTFPFLGKYGYRMQQGYTPTDDFGVATKGYLDTITQDSSFVKSNGDTPMNSGYSPIEDLDVVTANYLLSGDAQLSPPKVEPCGEGILWNNNGVLEVSGPCIGKIRYFTTATSLDFSILGTLQATNGYVDVISDDNPILQANKSSITKIEVLKYGNRTTWFKLAYGCTNMTEFVVTATDVSKVSDFSYAWSNCSSLTAFPLLDVSSGTDFDSAWSGCSSLTSFPLLDVSSGTNFTFAWENCSSLTAFPLLDVSSGTEFGYAWDECSSLTTFPSLDVSSGTRFYSAWNGCSSLTSFPQLDVSSGTNFTNAWSNCSSLTTFPLLDVSSGTDFSGAWNGCSSLTTFPLLDVSSGTNFIFAWNGCSSLTTFPLLDVSSGTDFTNAWFNCSSLPHCPGGNEVTIPQGATTTNMCIGI